MREVQRKTPNLRIGRRSVPGANYFVTTCTAGRQTAFAQLDAKRAARTVLLRMVDDGDFPWLAATVMPDHIHLFFCLGDRLDLSQCIARVKGLITRRMGAQDFLWQENAFEHRLRDDEDPEAYAFYIFMNPYRAGLSAINETWPGWICTEPKRFRFLDALDPEGVPPPEWLERDETAGGALVVGD